MKSLVALVLIAPPAAAEVVMTEPPVVGVVCGSPARMPALTTCLDQHLLVGTQIGSIVGPANQPNGARLFAIAAKDARHHELQSVALFLQDAKGRWRIACLHELGGTRGEITLTRFEKIGLAQHQGYRFDFSSLSAKRAHILTRKDRRVERGASPRRRSCVASLHGGPRGPTAATP